MSELKRFSLNSLDKELRECSKKIDTLSTETNPVPMCLTTFVFIILGFYVFSTDMWELGFLTCLIGYIVCIVMTIISILLTHLAYQHYKKNREKLENEKSRLKRLQYKRKEVQEEQEALEDLVDFFQYEEVIKSFYSYLKSGKFRYAYDDYITSLNLKGKMREYLKSGKFRYEIDDYITSLNLKGKRKNEKELKIAVDIVVTNIINIIKKKVLDLGTKFTRLEVKEISEKCKINHEEIIIRTVKEMIKKKEIYAEYFSSSRAVAFNQQANIDEIDRLMDAYKDWEKKEIRKK